MSLLLKVNTARNRTFSFVGLSLTSLSLDLSKNGAAFGGGPAPTNITGSYYYVSLGTGDTDTLGDLCYRFTDSILGVVIPNEDTVDQVVVDVPGSTVASVVGNVGGNVVGSVASVAGNVGGNVTGSVASVVGDVGGNVVGNVGGNVAGGVAGNVGGSVASVTGNIGGNLLGSVAGGVAGGVAGDLGGSVLGTIAALSSQAKTDVEDAVWDGLHSNHLTAGTFGLFVDVAISSVSGGSAPTAAQNATAVWQDLLASSDFSTVASIGKLLKDDIDAAISTRTKPADTQAAVTLVATATNLTNAPTVGDFTAAMKTSLQTAADAAITANTLVLEIEAETDGIAAIPTNPLLTTDTRLNHLDADVSSRTKPADTQAAVTLVATTTNLTNAPTVGDFTAAMKASLDAATPAVTVSDKTGYSLASTGLDAIAVTAPSSVASTFPQMLVQLWRRFFKKVTKDSAAGNIKTYANDGSTVVTTQTVSTVGSVDTVGPAT